ncbi:penicillin-binding protein 2 [Hellea sp.]|nr:penicillin-binding protein 2 [Hellea sp.]
MSEHDQGPDEGVITRRTLMLGAGGAGIFGVLASRLYYLQVVKAEDYRVLSDDNRFNFKISLPSRGRIMDRFGENLAVNKQDYRVVMIPEQVKDVEATLKRISNIVPLNTKMLDRIRKDIRDHARFVPILIDDHLDWKTFSALNFNIPDLPGVIPQVGEGRFYPNKGLFAHTLGYVGRANPKDVEKDNDPMLRQPTFRIGKTGVEAAADKTLRGSAGKLKVEVNALGRIVREWPDPNDAAIKGKDVWLTLDAELQRYGAELFEEDSGGLAVIDVMTGELRTLLSMPTFDANLFVSGLTQADMNRLNNDEKRPQYNKVLSGGYPPASTFKMTVMLAALESGLIDPKKKVFCTQKLRLGNRIFHCWKRGGHGAMDMRDGLKNSCDIYFYETAQIIGMEKIAEMGRKLGFGTAYDIGISGVKPGIMPDPAWKQARLGNGWRMGDTLNASIGQGFVLATPLQLAVMAGRIANGQKALVPNLLVGQDLPELADLDIDPEHIAFVQDAMWSVCEEPGGTAYRANGLGIKGLDMAGKTGTGQVRGISTSERQSRLRKHEELPWKLRDHSIFVGYAPYNAPRFAVGCVVEHGGSGSKRAASIVRAVLGRALERDGLGPETELKTNGATL